MKFDVLEHYYRVSANPKCVDRAFLTQLIDGCADVVAQADYQSKPFLVIVECDTLKLDSIDAIETWNHAAKRGMQRAAIAYVIVGRPISTVTQFIEKYTQNRGMRVRYFSDENSAVQWLLE
jgi:hypothetical protein